MCQWAYFCRPALILRASRRWHLNVNIAICELLPLVLRNLLTQSVTKFLAQLIAKHYKTTSQVERVPGCILTMHCPTSFRYGSTIDGVNTYFIARAAARSGLKVALSGLGGDEMFAGYDTFRRVQSLSRYLGWVPGLSTLGKGLRIVAAPLMGRMMNRKYLSLLEYGGSTAGAYMLGRGLFLPWELPDLMDPDFAAEGWRQLEPLVRLENTIAGLSSAENRFGPGKVFTCAISCCVTPIGPVWPIPWR